MVKPIYEFEWKQNTLDILICDPTDEQIDSMVDYCTQQALKLVSFENVDVSDCSGQWDTIASFKFETTEDALQFKLRFK